MFALVSMCVFGFVSIASAAAEGEPESAEAAYSMAKDAFKAGDLVEALRLLELANDKEPRPLFIYNIGRVKASMGQIREAYETYLKVLALKDTDENLRNLTQAQADKLKDLIDKALLRITGASGGVTVQVGESLITEFAEDQELEPGKYRACAVLKGGKELRCIKLNLRAGRRTDWDVSRKAKASGRIALSKKLGLTTLSLGGTPLLVDASKVRYIQIEAGRHLFKYGSKKGEGEVTLQVLPGAKLPWKEGGAKTEGSSRAKVSSQAAPSSGPGPWPWVLSGMGAAMGGAGAFLASAGSSEQSDMEAECNASTDQQACFANWDQDRYDSAGSKIDTGVVLAGVGGACVVGGIVWWFMTKDQAVAPKKSAQRGEFLQWWIQPNPRGGLSAVGRF